VRFVVRDRGIRDVKDAISRDILLELEEAGIRLASASFGVEVVGLPPLRIEPAANGKAGSSAAGGTISGVS
jgi:hypothetical protein